MDIAEKIKNDNMIGECCDHRAKHHSTIRPFPCTIEGCSCTKWDSGE